VQKQLQLATAAIKKAGGNARAYTCDVTSRTDMQRVADAVCADAPEGRADIVVCNAGVLLLDKIVDLNEQRLRKTYEVNVFGCVWVCGRAHCRKSSVQTLQPFLNGMIKRNDGHIVVIGSGTSHFAIADGAAYWCVRTCVPTHCMQLVQVCRARSYASTHG
jgi:NAD(P)-dependent dehydrogenase (short-subunit alcohol dehydrogenase family)